MGLARSTGGSGTQYIIKNSNFGAGEFDNKLGWVWGAALPANKTGCSLSTSPVDGGAKLYSICSTCIATSADEGATWSACWTGLEGQPIRGLAIKDESTMFVLRTGLVPLRTLPPRAPTGATRSPRAVHPGGAHCPSARLDIRSCTSRRVRGGRR